MKEALCALLEQALNQLRQDGTLPPDAAPEVRVDSCRDRAHGDLATNLAMASARSAGLPPRQLAGRLLAALPANELIDRAEIAGPGFVNFWLRGTASAAVVAEVLAAGEGYGCNDSGRGRKVQVEFVSANPTGPLHVGHGRGAALGDSLSRLLAANGWEVVREFYYNDAGAQINNLALSVQARCRGLAPGDEGWPADGYQGQYIADLALDYLAGASIDATDQHVTAAADPDDLTAIRHFAVAYLRREQDLDLRAFDVNFDVFYLESSLYASGRVEETVRRLADNGHCYERDGALWLETTRFGDDKDRVMRKADGSYTYFVPDVAYHVHKWQRGFGRVVNEQGADHHSTVTRVRAGLQAMELDIPAGWPDYVLHQMVLVVRGGEEVKISKRAGSYVTLRDLISEVGRDATRLFLAARAPSSQLTFDIDLAKSQSNDNPVYYIQYAHARVCSVLRKLEEQGLQHDVGRGLGHVENLESPEEKTIMARLSQYPDTVQRACAQSEPHLIANYLKELAADFHSYYNTHKVLVEEGELRDARLALSAAVAQVIRNGLGLLGVSAPEQM